MNYDNIIDLLQQIRIVPVVKIENVEDAEPLAKALCCGGLPIAEITFRTTAAAASIKEIARKCPEMTVGAGTVLNVNQAKQAVEAGAKFLVSPGLDYETVEYAIENGIPIIPGACTPTEVTSAIKYKLKIVKFFPAKQYGGIETIRALAAPFSSIRFMPTGGINEGNMLDYLGFKKVIAIGGSWMVRSDLIKNKQFDEITRITAKAVSIAKQSVEMN